MFVGYCDKSKAYRIYVLAQRTIEFSRDVTFDEDAALRKARDSPPLAITKRQAANEKEATSESEPKLEKQLANNPMGSMDSLDPPPHDPLTRKGPLWLQDTLQYAKQHVAPRGTFRESKKRSRFQGYVSAISNIIQVEPCTFEEAAKEQVWKDAITEIYESIIQNDVWEVVPRPQGKSVVTSKWLFKIKHRADGSIEKYKARFLAIGFSLKEGINYDDIFAPIARYTTIRSVVVLAASQGWDFHQMDVKIAFLHGFVKEEVFVEQP